MEVNIASVTDASLSAYLNWPRDNLCRLLAGVQLQLQLQLQQLFVLRPLQVDRGRITYFKCCFQTRRMMR